MHMQTLHIWVLCICIFAYCQNFVYCICICIFACQKVCIIYKVCILHINMQTNRTLYLSNSILYCSVLVLQEQELSSFENKDKGGNILRILKYSEIFQNISEYFAGDSFLQHA